MTNSIKKGKCEIIICNNENNFLDIETYLKNSLVPPYLVSENEKIISFFKKKNNCATLNEIFTNYSNNTFDIYHKTVQTIKNYQKVLENEKFDGYTILDGLEYSLIDPTLFFEKSKKILQERTNVIFIFDEFSTKCFTILEVARKMGYKINQDYAIKDFSSNSMKIITPETVDDSFEKKKMISKYYKYYSTYSKNTSSRNNIKLIVNFSKKMTPYILNKISSKFHSLVYEKLKKEVIKSISKKISKFGKIEYAFFISGGRKDVVETYGKIIDKFVQNGINFLIFTSDPITSSFISKYEKYRIDLFEEVFAFENRMKQTADGKEFKNNIQKISQKNYLGLLFFKKFNTEIIDGVFHSLATSVIVDSILYQLKLKKIVLVDGPILGKVTARLAKNYKIPTLSVETLLIDHNELFSLSYKADKICVYGKQALEMLIKHDYNEQQIVITGNPFFDYVNSINVKKSRVNLEEIINVKKFSKLITIAVSRWHKNDEQWIPKFINYCNSKNYQVVIKLHPRYKINSEESEKKIEIIEKNCNGKNFHFFYDINLPMLLASSDLVISDYSGVGIETILLGIPLVIINFIKEELDNSPKFQNTGAAFYVDEYNLLEKICEKILQKDEYNGHLNTGKQKIIEMYNFPNDGKSVERIYDLIYNN